MATTNIAAEPLRRRRRKPGRTFFLGMAAFAVLILALAFVPEFVRFARGTFPIAPILHVHAGIMALWVAAFVVQAWLGATGRTAQHRRIGPYALGMGWLAWASMIFVEMRAIIVHPITTDRADYDWDLPGPYVYLTFPIFLVWAFRERRRPAWHKRLITFALFLSLLAAMQRYLWLPIDHGYRPFAAALDVAVLTPLVFYDWHTQGGRLHPATVRGAALLLGSQAILFALWGTELWRSFAASVTLALHG